MMWDLLWFSHTIGVERSLWRCKTGLKCSTYDMLWWICGSGVAWSWRSSAAWLRDVSTVDNEAGACEATSAWQTVIIAAWCHWCQWVWSQPWATERCVTLAISRLHNVLMSTNPSVIVKIYFFWVDITWTCSKLYWQSNELSLVWFSVYHSVLLSVLESRGWISVKFWKGVCWYTEHFVRFWGWCGWCSKIDVCLPSFDFWCMISQDLWSCWSWRRGVVVTALVVSTKLLYVKPG